jgi:ankyrin repeat protein
MPANPEASSLNLEYYRKQAKALLKAAQTGNSSARERIARQLKNFDPVALQLHDAQLTVAREQGFRSWPRFRTFIVQSRLDDPGRVAAFIDAAVSDLRRAEELLAAHPGVARGGFYVDLVLGNWRAVDQTLAAAPALARVGGGPQNYSPLAYACFSRFAARGCPRAADLAETARVLLQSGADPNASIISEGYPDNPLSCLYAATGLNNNSALARVLLEAGANPDDGESLYHSIEHPDLECVKLLLSHGAKPGGTNALNHMLDREDLAGVHLLLAGGADPNEKNHRGETALHWALWRGRSAAVVGALLDAGANPDPPRHDGCTPYALAVRSGETAIAALLGARGASTDASPLDRLLGACATADAQELDRLAANQPAAKLLVNCRHLLPDLAMSHRTAAVRGLLAAGMPVDARGDMGATALHWACWKGYADLVDLLLQHGASLAIEDEQFHGTPPGWFGHGSHNCAEPGGDYAGVARALIEAGAVIPSVDLPTGRPEVDAVLREHGLI